MYIAEVAPAQARGKLVAINQLTIVIGILLAQVVNWLIAEKVPAHATTAEILHSWNGQIGWRWMFGVTAIPSLLFFTGMWFVPESPRWLAKSGRTDESRAILTKIGGQKYANDALAEIDTALASESKQVGLSELFAPGMMKVLLLGIGLAVFQQWCGINVIFNYAQEIFAGAGYQISGILFNIVITGAVNLVFTVLALLTIDRFGRRLLLLTGVAGLTVIYTLLGTLYHLHFHGVPMLVLVLAAIACYAMSLAPVTWVVISEIFPNRIRSGAVSVAVTALWTACFVLTYTFPLLNAAISTAGVFFLYASICLAGLLYLSMRLPETRNRTLEEIETSLRGAE
jgi:sugar porter (SP) family MFS transporter